MYHIYIADVYQLVKLQLLLHQIKYFYIVFHNFLYKKVKKKNKLVYVNYTILNINIKKRNIFYV